MTRRERRDCIFKILFQKEFYQTEEMEEQGQLFLEENKKVNEEEMEEMAQYVNDIVLHIPELDEKINEVAKGWKTNRMAKVDLTLIRLALYEILYDENVPNKVAINEAVELTKIYSKSDSTAFVNGVLGKLAQGK